MTETRLRIGGMTCGNCARHVREALAAVAGVDRAEVDLEGAAAVVFWKNGAIPDAGAALVHAVAEAGYEAAPLPGGTSDGEGQAPPAPASVWDRVLTLGLPVTALLMAAEWIFGLAHHAWYGWAALALTLPVQVWVGGPFYRNAWAQFHQGRLTMDTLVALGSGSAFLLSCYGLLRPGTLAHPYFMEAAAILSLVGLGHWLEALIARRANATLRTLLDLTPARARRLGANAAEEEVPVGTLQPDDRILLKPGDRIPIDGAIMEGHGTVDESLLTGEAEPVEKGVDSPVYAGTLVLNRRLVVRVTGVGAATALARIVEVVKRAQESRASIERLVDKISNVFVLVVVSLAILTLMGWGIAGNVGWERALVIAISVLVVACPCAMGLATPAALLAAGNVAARRGILFRDAAALEKCGKITAVLFDKTGTLTDAVPPVAHVELHGGMGADELGALARGLAASSTHPLSRSVAAHFAQAAPIVIKDWSEERGEGVQGVYQGETVRLGSPAWLIANGIAFPDAALPKLGGMLALSRGRQLLGLVSFRTGPKPGAARVVRELIGQDLLVYLVTGDGEAAAQRLGSEVGIPEGNIFSGIRPEQKADLVSRLQAEGKKVAFVGDGINDAPALTQADLGIAALGASDVARESADVLLLKRDIEAVPEILALSAATLWTIRQNLFWAFFYNAAAIPLAMAGFISPVFSALAMGLSDVFVMGNAWRLSRWNPKG